MRIFIIHSLGRGVVLGAGPPREVLHREGGAAEGAEERPDGARLFARPETAFFNPWITESNSHFTS